MKITVTDIRDTIQELDDYASEEFKIYISRKSVDVVRAILRQVLANESNVSLGE